ncbi:NAD binding domain of 6-phosphogluconate dehydrogenase-domain-containing protein [Annulohypoxylon maeteangense]|uniref:NAD binding domain of 6-phosphogluconate dehydrogenase-domain-containing protein n=1 Tax=Annulohypoxylon maeteangense TaxID=1927788 RepID=UPI0020080FC8|nr:NAD binding domain of 6-phosphogluconate dehydrogenase-domain-containing protein [Annulohypoxylon maeteangense]KAI0880622.1 NAD binding domain of 6-phosphogluconate dehydrogenase-domain-containing protein [Annulohypoxylon maeteangense]
MAETKPNISFIGLGAMGFGMATNLVKRGYKVTGFDVWKPTLEKFRAAGGNIANTPVEAVKDNNYCVCMVATAQQAQAVLIDGENPALSALPKGAVLLLCSTVPCAYVQNLERQLSELGRGDIRLIDSPVSGGAARAADGTLSIMAGGSDDAIEKGRFLLQVMSDPKKLYIVNGGVGAGSNMKMCHQVLAANQILAASEGLGFATQLGLDPHSASQEILRSDAWAWMFENRLPRMLDPEFKPVASALTIILKDTGIITSEARRSGFSTPMTSTAEQVYFSGLGRGYGPDDDSSLIRLYTEGKGKVGPVKGVAESDESKLKLVVALLKGIYLCSAAETIAFASRCNLDLDQVFDLCINAAGGSTMFQTVGPEIIKLCRGQPLSIGDGEGFKELVQQLQEAVEEAQRLKTPVYLGSQALILAQLAAQLASEATDHVSRAIIAKVWGL